MITLKDFMEVVDYRITEGSEYCWQCFGDSAYCLSSWSNDHDGYSFNIIFDTKNQTVYIAEACDYKNNRAYRLINPEWQRAYADYADRLNPAYKDQAWDDVSYVDLETDEDWIQKSLAIKLGEEYDIRVSIPLEFTDEDLLMYMKMAHERDITFNQFVEEAIRASIDEFDRDPEGMKDRAKKWKADQTQSAE